MSKFRLMLAIVLSLFLSSASFAEVGIENSFGTGYGNSYGGLGFVYEFRTPSIIAFNVGAGYFPAAAMTGEDWVEDEILAETGLRIYFTNFRGVFRPYGGVQYGMLGIIAEQVFAYEYNYYGSYYYYEEKQEVVHGPSMLVGSKFVFNYRSPVKFFLEVAGGLSYAVNYPDWAPEEEALFLALDLGLGIAF